MKFQPNGHQSGIQGSIAVSRNRGGYFQRARVKGRNPRTPAQQTQRDPMRQASSKWTIKIIKCPATLAELQDPDALGRACLAKYPLPTVGSVIALRISQALDGHLSQPHSEVVSVTAAG